MQKEILYFIVKCVSVVCIVSGCAGMGFLKARELTLRYEALQEFGQLLLALKNEIRYLGMPMPEVFEHLILQCSKFYQPFLREMLRRLDLKDGTSLADIWQQTAGQCFAHSCLKQEDILWIQQTGKTLGYLDAEAQQQNIDLQVKQLEDRTMQEKHQMAARQRIYQCVGIFAGLLCAVCLM